MWDLKLIEVNDGNTLIIEVPFFYKKLANSSKFI